MFQKMDLFTVDTVGEQTLLGQDEYEDSEVIYSYNKGENTENGKIDEETNSNNDTEADTEEEYDYGGKNTEANIYNILASNLFRFPIN